MCCRFLYDKKHKEYHHYLPNLYCHCLSPRKSPSKLILMEESAMKPAKACHMNLKKEEAFLFFNQFNVGKLSMLRLQPCYRSKLFHSIEEKSWNLVMRSVQDSRLDSC